LRIIKIKKIPQRDEWRLTRWHKLDRAFDGGG